MHLYLSISRVSTSLKSRFLQKIIEVLPFVTIAEKKNYPQTAPIKQCLRGFKEMLQLELTKSFVLSFEFNIFFSILSFFFLFVKSLYICISFPQYV